VNRKPAGRGGAPLSVPAADEENLRKIEGRRFAKKGSKVVGRFFGRSGGGGMCLPYNVRPKVIRRVHRWSRQISSKESERGLVWIEKEVENFRDRGVEGKRMGEGKALQERRERKIWAVNIVLLNNSERKN